MHKLTVTLPPFAPDYSGVCSALFELGGMLLIHDASGCTGNYTSYDEPRWYGSRSAVFCTALRELDAVLGSDDKLVDKILRAAREMDPRFIGIMGSPVPMVIGSDLEGVAREVEAASGIPSFGFATTGLKFYDSGVGKALTALARRFLRPAGERLPGTVNLLGATPLDFGIHGAISAMVRALEDRGFRVLSTFAMDSSLDELAESARASVNLVISVGGFPLARYFAETFGTPYVIGQPLGGLHCDQLCELISRAERGEEVLALRSEQEGPARTLLIGEQVTMHSLREWLIREQGFRGVDLAVPFGSIPSLGGAETSFVASEKAIKEQMKGEYHMIMGDPLYRQLLRAPLQYVEIPHVAVSSKLYWDCPWPLAGDGIYGVLKGDS